MYRISKLGAPPAPPTSRVRDASLTLCNDIPFLVQLVPTIKQPLISSQLPSGELFVLV